MAENTMTQDVGYIRFLNAVPEGPAIDLYVNDTLAESGLGYQEFSEYLQAKPGQYQVRITATGQPDKILLESTVDLLPLKIYTAAFIDSDGTYALDLVPDDKSSQANKADAFLRFIDLAPESPPFDIYLDNRLAISGITYEEISKYFTLSPGRHTLEVRRADTGQTVIRHPRMLLRAGNLYAGYIVGLTDKTPELEILLPLEGASYLPFGM